MVFSSNVFLFYFLPIITVFYYLFVKLSGKSLTAANIWLLIGSLYFYSWEDLRFLFVIIPTLLVNVIVGRILVLTEDQKKRKLVLIIGIVLDFASLFVFKYLDWICGNRLNITLPLGISFYTFQAVSYILDIYRGGYTKEQTNLINVGLYIAFFPQLIAGPIVRFSTVSKQLTERKHSFEKFTGGFYRFAVGFAKKVLLANQLGQLTSLIFDSSVTNAAMLSWLGAIACVLQVYFDFSGYSDMAIGLGKMFGFDFNENFNYPFVSKSISEYWRRWHISLGEWFRDYLYYPLSIGPAVSIRKNLSKKIASKKAASISALFVLFVVWLATGIWHGANFTFIVWGLLQFIFIAFERNKTPKKFWCHVKVILFCLFCGVIFNAESLSYAFTYIREMLCLHNNKLVDSISVYWLSQYAVVLVSAVVFSLPVVPYLDKKFGEKSFWYAIKLVALLLFFIASLSYTISGSYNPFIYFNF